ncbi:MAG: phenylacetate-CoA oxygenase subunit PaaC [Chitinophagaceae bacterium]|nr:phenylacetate-CoA oxygenase subunit PaaC [Chitinophagaceae bacterium]MBK8951089.1 phenylacetate-CoA oxygenase subunit PaaC [Chitinophagaceae bacterium]
MSKHLTDFILHLADSTLILGQRNGEWCGHGPVLEQDIAITNITLDLIGQARSLYQYAAKLINEVSKLSESEVPPAEGFKAASEDTLAYLRTEREFKNFLLVEQPNSDWGQTILRQFLFSTWQYYLYQQLKEKGSDTTLAAIAEKSLKEISYHVRWSGEWVIRLGDGTAESKKRMAHAIQELWPYTGELFLPAPYEKVAEVDFDKLKPAWFKKVSDVFNEATLLVPQHVYMHTGGKTGTHTEHLGYMLAELQYMQRSFPGCEW